MDREAIGEHELLAANDLAPSEDLPPTALTSVGHGEEASDEAVNETMTMPTAPPPAAPQEAVTAVAPETPIALEAPIAVPQRTVQVAPQRVTESGAGRNVVVARRVKRILRHIDPWSVMKMAAALSLCAWIVFMTASVILWNAAVSSGTVDNIESLARKLLVEDTFELQSGALFEAAAVGGLVAAGAATGGAVLTALLFNLISDLTGGIRLSVVEEESARYEPR